MNSTQIQGQIDELNAEVTTMKNRLDVLPGLMVKATSAAALAELHHEAEFSPFIIGQKETALLYLQLDLYEAQDSEAEAELAAVNAELAPLVAERQEVEQRTGALMAPLHQRAERIHRARESRRFAKQDARQKLRTALESKASAARLLVAPHVRALNVNRG